MNILALSGSLRGKSNNTAPLRVGTGATRHSHRRRSFFTTKPNTKENRRHFWREKIRRAQWKRYLELSTITELARAHWTIKRNFFFFNPFGLLFLVVVLTGCGATIPVKPGENIQLKGISSINLINGDRIYVQDAIIHDQGIDALNELTKEPVKIPREYIVGISDKDYLKGAKTGLISGALAGLGVGTIIAAQPVAPDAGAGLQFLAIPFASGLGAIVGGAAGGLLGYESNYRYEGFDNSPPPPHTLPDIQSFRSMATQRRFNFGVDIGGGAALFPIPDEPNSADLRRRIGAVNTITLRGGYRTSLRNSVGAEFLQVNDRSLGTPGDGTNYYGKPVQFENRRSMQSWSLFNSWQPRPFGWHYNYGAGIALFESHAKATCCNTTGNYFYYSWYALSLMANPGYKLRISDSFALDFSLKISGFVASGNLAGIANLSIGLLYF